MFINVLTCQQMLQFPNDPSVVNVSHIIKSVSFGPSFPGQVNPLDGVFLFLGKPCKQSAFSQLTLRLDNGSGLTALIS